MDHLNFSEKQLTDNKKNTSACVIQVSWFLISDYSSRRRIGSKFLSYALHFLSQNLQN